MLVALGTALYVGQTIIDSCASSRLDAAAWSPATSKRLPCVARGKAIGNLAAIQAYGREPYASRWIATWSRPYVGPHLARLYDRDARGASRARS